MVQRRNKKSTGKLIAAFLALISLTVIVNIGVQVDIGFRIEKHLATKPVNNTPHSDFEQHVVQDFSFRFSADGSGKVKLDKESE